MEYIPLNYDQINLIAGTFTPSTIKPCNNKSYGYWQRSLFQRAISVISIENLPIEWHGNVKDFLYYCLFTISLLRLVTKTSYTRVSKTEQNKV